MTISGTTPIANGDGLGFFNAEGVFTGFRVNKAEGNRLMLLKPIAIPEGTVIYRNRNKDFDDMMAGATATRAIPADMTLRLSSPRTLALDIAIDKTTVATATIESPTDFEDAKTEQTEARKRVLAKLGDTVYSLENLTDQVGNLFIPASTLTALRRKAVSVLDSARKASYPRQYRAERKEDLIYPVVSSLGCRDNVANSLARKFYLSTGITGITPAMEVKKPDFSKDQQVMETRYCLRRELGACLKTKSAGQLPDRLYLVSGKNRYRLDFDCEKCMMRVIRPAD